MIPCKQCQKMFLSTKKSITCCSPECRRQFYVINQSKKKYAGKVQGKDFIICKICGFHAAALSGHLSSHNISTEDYRQKYNCETCCEMYSKNASQNLSGEKNPGWKHGGKLSPFSKNFIHKDRYNPSLLAKKAKATAKENFNDSTTIDYYIKRGLSQEEAKKALSKRQTTFSLEKCIQKYGQKEGTARWLARQEKWMKNYKKGNYSKISQQLFFEIIKRNDLFKEAYFAENNGEKSISFNNKIVRPDFLYKNKVIEFDGDYWHGEARGNQDRDNQKNKFYEEANYKLLRITEREYNKNKEETINKCINFLTQ